MSALGVMVMVSGAIEVAAEAGVDGHRDLEAVVALDDPGQVTAATATGAADDEPAGRGDRLHRARLDQDAAVVDAVVDVLHLDRQRVDAILQLPGVVEGLGVGVRPERVGDRAGPGRVQDQVGMERPERTRMRGC